MSGTWSALEARVIRCRDCPRLVAWREKVGREKRRAYRDHDYWAKPVPGFGDQRARIAVVGLAPGAHGSNRTGRMFTGDSSGDFLYPALHRAGFASQPAATGRHDGLKLHDLFITAVCRCAPPDNKPLPREIATCRHYLEEELALLEPAGLEVIVALGKIAFDEVIRFYRARGRAVTTPRFAHGAIIEIGRGPRWLLASYHPSRQNTQTGRLTRPMFDAIWKKARSLSADRL